MQDGLSHVTHNELKYLLLFVQMERLFGLGVCVCKGFQLVVGALMGGAP